MKYLSNIFFCLFLNRLFKDFYCLNCNKKLHTFWKLRCIDLIQLKVKQFIWSFISQNLPWKWITPISDKHNIFVAIIVHPLSFSDESSEQTIMALITASFPRTVRMCEVYFYRSVILYLREFCKLASIIASNCLKHLTEFSTIVFL